MDPGIEDLMQLAKLERMRARLPPPEDVAQAFERLFAHKLKSGTVLEDNQAQLALQALQYCSRSRAERQARGESIDGLLSESVLNNVARTLLRIVQLSNAPNPDLARAFHDEIVALRNGPTNVVSDSILVYAQNLAYSGQPGRARDLVVEYEESSKREAMLSDVKGPENKDTSASSQKTAQAKEIFRSRLQLAWQGVLAGFVHADDEPELLNTLQMMQARGYKVSLSQKSAVISFYLRRRDIQPIKTWYADLWQQVSSKSMAPPTAETVGKTVQQVLQWCIRHNELEYGHQIVRDATISNPPKPIWDAIFVWAAGTGKGPDEINRMFGVMEASNKTIPDEAEHRHPDITTINALVEFAIEKSDPYLAERFIAIGKARNIEADARTYVLQMQYRLKVHDVDGALTAYANSQAMDLSSNEDVPTVNALIVALCNSKRHDFDSIMNVAADLSDRQARFDASTVSALTRLHLGRDEIHDVVDLLNTHAFHYSSAERQAIREDILAFALDPETPTSRTWDAYTILRSIFDESPREQRTTLMLDFFRRDRPDMAVHVFNGMRSHSRADTMPTIDTYVSAFLGAAKLKDLESLEVIHNQLKLDFNINPSTRLYNALILGYTACEQPRRALRFWDDISASKEGPTYNSIHITFRACEKAPFGDLKARELWGKLRKMKVELDQQLWASYVGALAGNGDNSYVMSEVEKGEREREVEVDVFLLGSLFNAAAGQGKQREVEEWGRERWPTVWKELEALGEDVEENGMRAFRIEREVEP